MASPHSSQSERTSTTQRTGIIAQLLLGIIRFYRYFISPMLAPRCRFNPTCSRYALDAIQIHGALKGSWLALKRISKCHPLHAGGDDPVPPAKNGKKSPKTDR